MNRKACFVKIKIIKVVTNKLHGKYYLTCRNYVNCFDIKSEFEIFYANVGINVNKTSSEAYEYI